MIIWNLWTQFFEDSVCRTCKTLEHVSTAPSRASQWLFSNGDNKKASFLFINLLISVAFLLSVSLGSPYTSPNLHALLLIPFKFVVMTFDSLSLHPLLFNYDYKNSAVKFPPCILPARIELVSNLGLGCCFREWGCGVLISVYIRNKNGADFSRSQRLCITDNLCGAITRPNTKDCIERFYCLLC